MEERSLIDWFASQIAAEMCDGCRFEYRRIGNEHDDHGERSDCAAFMFWEAVEKVRSQLPEECCCDGGEQGDGLCALPHEPHCPRFEKLPDPPAPQGR